mmetsp:Transcript_19691/g.61158  ORF Transcript_19691/g.61158 Transcript_19691/m.61158 type:complete len:260 (-) Transcript_19691:550-1329(-)
MKVPRVAGGGGLRRATAVERTATAGDQRRRRHDEVDQGAVARGTAWFLRPWCAVSGRCQRIVRAVLERVDVLATGSEIADALSREMDAKVHGAAFRECEFDRAGMEALIRRDGHHRRRGRFRCRRAGTSDAHVQGAHAGGVPLGVRGRQRVLGDGTVVDAHVRVEVRHEPLRLGHIGVNVGAARAGGTEAACCKGRAHEQLGRARGRCRRLARHRGKVQNTFERDQIHDASFDARVRVDGRPPRSLLRCGWCAVLRRHG